MKNLFLSVIVIYLFAPVHSAAAEYYCGEQAYKKCIQELREKKPASPECEKLSAYEKTKPFHWQGERYYEHEEWKIRQELSGFGLQLPYDMAPIDYARDTVAGGEVVAILEPAVYRPEPDLGSRFVLVAFGGRLTECYDSADYPLASVTIYARKSGSTQWKRFGNQIPADSEAQDQSISLHNLLRAGAKARCPKTARIFKQGVAICFTSVLEREWPEVHVWRDHRASTGIVRDSYFWSGTAWDEWIIKSSEIIDVIDNQPMVIEDLLASESEWRPAEGGVRTIEKKTGYIQLSPEWTRRLLKPVKVTSIPEAPSLVKPGFYCIGRAAPFNGYYNDCVELVEKGSKDSGAVDITDPPDGQVFAVRSPNYVHFSLPEKTYLVSAMRKALINKVQSARRYVFRVYDGELERVPRIHINLTKPLEVRLKDKTFSVEKLIVPMKWPAEHKEYSDIYNNVPGHIYAFGKDAVEIELDNDVLPQLFCGAFDVRKFFERPDFCTQ
jgi:hypothetical protein